MAIGWHFLYEGVEKLYSTPEGRRSLLVRLLPPLPAPPPMEKAEPPFSAEAYLRNATGPLAPNFRSLVPDVDSREKLDLSRIRANWGAELERASKHYNFTQGQHDDAEKELNKRETEAEDWFRNSENRDKIEKYFRDLAHVRAVERNPKALESERSQAIKNRVTVEADRRELVQVVDGW